MAGPLKILMHFPAIWSTESVPLNCLLEIIAYFFSLLMTTFIYITLQYITKLTDGFLQKERKRKKKVASILTKKI